MAWYPKIPVLREYFCSVNKIPVVDKYRWLGTPRSHWFEGVACTYVIRGMCAWRWGRNGSWRHWKKSPTFGAIGIGTTTTSDLPAGTALIPPCYRSLLRKKRPITRWDLAPPKSYTDRVFKRYLSLGVFSWDKRSNRVPNLSELRFLRQDFIVFGQFVYSLYIPKITPCTLQISLSFDNLYIPFIYRKSAIRYSRFL